MNSEKYTNRRGNSFYQNSSLKNFYSKLIKGFKYLENKQYTDERRVFE